MTPVWKLIRERRMETARKAHYKMTIPRELMLDFAAIFEICDWLNGALDGADINGWVANDLFWIERTRMCPPQPPSFS